ncbi:hypothetical protein JK386_10885 [Nocardioides sp. zg-536]|uniref:Uncharacterized protein n=1 Tax=Nocardioides faecalis TaxID=2803858 RepID=A0A938Y738_9ACTN|nr:hypothetical protein [Nocardioides faecalis]MBM9460409.1 hypothetical protein [Nocardioides faecalis]QVI59766.1 hypothetical protein KG111_05375 [Nocardioides faecalis]
MLVAVMMSGVLLVSAAFTVDLGQQRVLRRDMQTVADIAALDLAWLLESDKPVQEQDPDALTTALNNNLRRNSDSIGIPLTVKECLDKGRGVSARSGVCWEFVKRAGSSWQPAEAADDIAEGVRVFARSEVAFAFAGVLGDNRSGSAQRSAVATRSDPSVCFAVGTKTLALDTSGGALSPLLDYILRVKLDAVGYDGLVDLRSVSVPLVDLMAELNVGSTSELATAAVGLGDLLVAAADIVGRDSVAAANVLRAVQIGVEDVRVRIGDILGVESGVDLNALAATINVLDLVSAAVVAAGMAQEGPAGLAIDGEVLGVVGAKVRITEPPKTVCGRKDVQAHSAQIAIDLEVDLPGSDLPGGLTSGRLGVNLEIGEATARLDALGCNPDAATLHVRTGAVSLKPAPPSHLNLEVTPDRFLDVLDPIFLLLNLGIPLKYPAGFPNGVGALLKATLGGVLGLAAVRLDVALGLLGVGVAEGSYEVDFPSSEGLPETLIVPEDGVGDVIRFGAPVVTLSNGQNALVNALGTNLSAALNEITTGLVEPLLTSVVNPLLITLLDPVLAAIGAKVGVAEVSMHDRPVCNNVRLVE